MSRKKNPLTSVGNGRVGRPPLEDFERRTRRIGVPVNEEEEGVINDKAKLVHMRKGVFLRHLGLGKRIRQPVPAINYRAYRQLGRLAADFSHALALVESGESTVIDRRLAERILDEIRHVEDLLMVGNQA